MIAAILSIFKSKKKKAEENLCNEFCAYIIIKPAEFKCGGESPLDSWISRLLWNANEYQRQIAAIENALKLEKFKQIPTSLRCKIQTRIRSIQEAINNIYDTIAEAN